MVTVDVTDEVKDFIRSISDPKLRAKVLEVLNCLLIIGQE
jgi:hypothetical protein